MRIRLFMKLDILKDSFSVNIIISVVRLFSSLYQVASTSCSRVNYLNKDQLDSRCNRD
jgi:hypothetical protein